MVSPTKTPPRSTVPWESSIQSQLGKAFNQVLAITHVLQIDVAISIIAIWKLPHAGLPTLQGFIALDILTHYPSWKPKPPNPENLCLMCL